MFFIAWVITRIDNRIIILFGFGEGKAAVRQHRPFREPGRPGGVLDLRDMVGRHIRKRRADWCRFEQGRPLVKR
jgi:hypothetical protein